MAPLEENSSCFRSSHIYQHFPSWICPVYHFNFLLCSCFTNFPEALRNRAGLLFLCQLFSALGKFQSCHLCNHTVPLSTGRCNPNLFLSGWANVFRHRSGNTWLSTRRCSWAIKIQPPHSDPKTVQLVNCCESYAIARQASRCPEGHRTKSQLLKNLY